MKNDQIIPYIISQLREIQDGNLWVGDTFKTKCNSITEEEAFIRPLPNLHSAAELIAHLIEWRKDIILVLKKGHGILTMESKNNWKEIEALKIVGWQNLLEDFKKTTAELINILQEKEDSFLKDQYHEQDLQETHPYAFIITGLVHHDLYHLGQLGMVIKLLKEGTFQKPNLH